MKARLGFLIFLVILFIYLPVPCLAATDSKQVYFVSGMIRMPEGRLAPPGGVRVEIRFQDFIPGVVVVIPEGSASTSYRLNLPYRFTGSERLQIRYISSGSGFVRSAYWSKGGMIRYGRFPTDFGLELSGASATGIDLSLIPDDSVMSVEAEQEIAETKAREIIHTLIFPQMTVFEKTLAIYDYLADNVIFYGNEPNPVAIIKSGLKMPEDIWNLYGILINQCTTCVGYQLALDMLLKMAGVETAKVGNTNHLWNKVKIDGQFYHIDSQGSLGNYSAFLKNSDQFINYWYEYDKSKEPICERIFRFKEEHYPHRELLSNNKYRRIIGTVRLADNRTAPKEGIKGHINGAFFYIPSGESSVSFILKEKLDDDKRKNGFFIHYFSSSPEVATIGYYSQAGTASKPGAASKIIPGDLDISGIDLVLVAPYGKTVVLGKNDSFNSIIEEDGRISYGKPVDRDGYWFLEPASTGYFRIKSSKTGHFMHIEHKNGTVECGEIKENWWSAEWKIEEKTDDSIQIVNRWQPVAISLSGNHLTYATQDELITSGGDASIWKINSYDSWPR